MPGPSSAPSTDPVRILLIVDDDPAVLRVLPRLIRSCVVDTATSGADALARLAVPPPVDAVLCDLRLPGVDGRSVYRLACDRSPELRDRFLFMTGDRATPPDGIDDCTRAVPVLQKPFDPTTLQEAVDDLLRRLPPRNRA